MKLKTILIFLGSLLLSTCAFAQEEEPVKASLVSEVESIEANKPFYIAVELNIKPGWETYWKESGDIGMPTRVKWHLPEGFRTEQLWPAPEVFEHNGITTYGYKDRVLLLTKVTPPALWDSSNLEVKAEVEWLACGERCVPGTALLTLQLPHQIGSLQEALDALPQSLDASQRIHITPYQNKWIVKLAGFDTDFQKLHFIPDATSLHPQQSWDVQGDDITVTLHPLKQSQKKLQGLLSITHLDGSTTTYHINHPIQETTHSIGYFILLAFLGGVLLNAMPCVLPVLGLKIMHFMKHADQKRAVMIQQGVSYTVGVVISFWVLAAVLLLLRTSGAHLGWGFQMQEPIFIASMMGLLFVFGLSLLGLFEMGTSLATIKTTTSNSTISASFCSGVLATLVATPCTGPLLGPALGAALVVPVTSAFAIFTALGLGMAAPYLFLSVMPQYVRLLPKPGQWMVTLKKVMGALMMLTCLWLLWVFFSQTSLVAALILCAALALLWIAFWLYGSWGSALHARNIRRYAQLATLALSLLAIALGAVGITYKPSYQTQNIATNPWVPFSRQALEEYRSQGKAVFIDFTAKWCLMCQANKVILYSSDIQKFFKDHHIIFMQADWTKKDEEITQFLEQMGRSGVPLYLFYSSNPSQEAIILPQTLTAKAIKQAFEKLHVS